MSRLTLDVADLTMLIERRLDTFAASPRVIVKGRRTFCKRLTKDPRIRPKRASRAIPKVESGGSMEQGKGRTIFCKVAEKLFIDASPCREEPSNSEGSSMPSEIRNTKAAINFGCAHFLPSNKVFGSSWGMRTGPKE